MSTYSKTRTVHYVLSTHWDREWYEPFQFYRYRLVQLLDRILDGIADGRLKGPFTTDGQSIILEDYLEIRPERREQVEQFCREGKLVVGPWYVLPDEFLVSGESLIRNLRMGRELARSFGAEPSQAGFVCDLFGHISQMPQILAGFGIECGFLWRGVNLNANRQLIWEGADGTETVCYRFAHHGYGDFSFKVREANEYDLEFDPERTKRKLREYAEDEAAHSEVSPVLFFDGLDHQEWDQDVYSVLGTMLGEQPGEFQYEHTNLDIYARQMMAERGKITTHLAGELREPGRTAHIDGHQISGVLSSRAWIKQQNAECENSLCHWAEPFSSFANLAMGAEYPASFLQTAWRHLIENHPHDSICGCSVDQVHEDMKYRFSQASQIIERLTATALLRIGANVDGEVGEKEVRIVVFNPLPTPLSEVVDLELDLPEDYPTFQEFFGFEPKVAFTIHDADGEEISFQRNRQTMHRTRLRLYDWKIPNFFKVNRIGVSLALDIPAMGYTTLTVRPGEEGVPKRYPQDTGLASSHRSMENEFIAVSIESNGTLTMTDKRNGEVYTDLLSFEERADIGDGWFHGIAVNDQIYNSAASPADVALIENGPKMAAFRIRTTMRVPEEFEFGGMARASKCVEFTIDTIVRLRAESDRLEIESRVENNAKDHRLRVLFPTNAESDVYTTDTPFDAVERRVPLREDNHEFMELDVETRPMQGWCAINDGHRGLALITTGQYEACVRDTANRPIALTLFRGTRRTVGRDGEPNGQLLGEMSFRYWIKPLSGELDPAEMFQTAQHLAAGIRNAHVYRRDWKQHNGGAALPSRSGMLRLDGPAIMTSNRQANGGVEVRLFNPTNKSIDAAIVLDPVMNVYTKADLVDFESQPAGESIKAADSKVSLALKPKKIVTVRLTEL